jgi:hypothetical protein
MCGERLKRLSIISIKFDLIVVLHTLMKPPSGFARRNGGCVLILGCNSAVFVHFSNLGTGPRPIGGSWGGFGFVDVRGDRASLLYTAFNCCVADCG